MNFFRRNGRGLLWAAGTLGLVVAGLLWLAAGFLANLATTVPPTARPALHPSRLGLECRDVDLRTEDGKKISAWWMPAGDKGKPPVLVLHGLGASKAHMIDYFLFAQKEGYPVMAIDFRGHGASDPSLTSIGFYESRDVISAIRFLRAEGAGDPVLWGTSMGAVSALLAAERDGAVAGVIADAPFDTYRNTIRHHAKLMYGITEFPLLFLAYPMIESRANFRMDEVDSLDPAMVRTIYEAGAGPKEFWIIPGEGHENRTFQAKFCETIRDFLSRVSMVRKN
ncbi:MAG: alpha/beta fold hydrolase [Verrucomicrobia bacterium]|nr:alpha/beta fold hydrolase [Verrucomicrobiota bacterium]